MEYRYSKAWADRGLGRSIIKVFGWQHSAPRVGGLFPGITDPIPAPASPTFSQCLEDATARALARAEEFVVLWSGGVDSTLVALCLASRKSPTQKVYITCSDQSMADSAQATKDALARAGCLHAPMSLTWLHQAVARGAVVVNGSHADSITLGEFADAADIHDQIWDMSMVQLVQAHMGLTRPEAEAHLEVIQPLFDLMPLEQTTLNKAFWTDFTCCWSRDEYDFTYRFDLGPPGETHFSFFSTSMFQQWAVMDAREKLRRGDSKWMIREACIRIAGHSLRFKKNLMDPAINAPGYQTLYSDRLLAIRSDYRLVLSGATISPKQP